MKRLLLTILCGQLKPSFRVLQISIVVSVLTLSSKCIAQDLNVYTFQVEGVDNIASAKEMTDYIRPLFNTPDRPFDYFPAFNGTTKQFEFKSKVAVTEDELRNVLESQVLNLINFQREAILVPETSNTEKE